MSAPHLKKLRENNGILIVLIVFFVLIIINSLILLFLLRGTTPETPVSGESPVPAEIADTGTDTGSEASASENGAQTSDTQMSGAQGNAAETDTSAADVSAEDSGSATGSEQAPASDSPETAAAEEAPAAEFSASDETGTGGDAEGVFIPTLNALEVDQILVGDRVSFSGTGEPGSEVLIQANGNTLESTLVNDDGTWSFTTSFDEPGDYSIQASTMDPAQASEPVVLSVVQPEVEPPTMDVAGTGEIVAGETFTLSGTGQPGSTLEIVSNGEVVDTVTVGDDGTWSYDFTFDTPDNYDITVRSVDANGNVLAESNTLSLLVEKRLMEAALDALAADEVAVGESVDFSGTGEPGGTVALAVNGEQLEEITVADDGTWTYVSAFSAPGQYDIQVYTLDETGAVLAESASETLVVAEPIPLTLNDLEVNEAITDETINLSGTANPGSEVQIMAGGQLFGVAEVKPDGTWLYAIAFSDPGNYEIFARVVDENDNAVESTGTMPVSILPRPSSENFAFIFPADGGEIIIGRLTIIGTGQPGLALEVLDDNTVLGAAEIEGNGEWYFSFEPDFGEHAFSAQLVDIDGTIGPLNLRVVSAADVICDSNLGISRGDNYIVGTCNTFGTVIERTGVDLESLISANPQIQNPDLIYPGDIINIP